MREREIFLEARDIADPLERGRFLDRACGDDRALRDDIEALLERETLAIALFEHPLPERFEGEGDPDAATPPVGSDRGAGAAAPSLGGASGTVGTWVPGALGIVRGLRPLCATPFGMACEGMLARSGAPCRVALLHPVLAGDPGARGRFLSTGRRLATLAHAGLPPVVAIGEEPLPWIATAPVAGESLAAIVGRGQGLPRGDALAIGMGLVDVLAAIHDAGIVHRALEPGAIVVSSQIGATRVCLPDAGLAAAAWGGTPRSPLPSHAPFMAPEEVLGRSLHPLDHRPDLFSLGCLLALLFTGRSPFAALSAEGSLRRVAEGAGRGEVIASMPPAVAAIVVDLIRLDPEERPARAGDVAARLATLGI